MRRPGPRSLALIAASLDRAPPPEVRAMSEKLAARLGVAAVLFYGNRLREAGASGLLDFYVLTESDAAYFGPGAMALAGRWLPPNVVFETVGDPAGDGEAPVSAKVAVMSLAAFRARMTPASRDTTVWARFAQPALLTHARDAGVRAEVAAAAAEACGAAAWWAARLAAPSAAPGEAWASLFEHTYGAELRVEGGAGRAREIVARAPALYEALHADCIAGVEIDAEARARARRVWARRRRWGKTLNVMRLCKAAFTFRGGLAYAISKVERHSGRPVELSGWERRVPWLAAPIVALRLWREKRLR
ncbi:MAG: hypothetical protein AAGI51_14575 [Pseudomonadota bacterium]